MKFLLFCGGGGKRHWPLSREDLPKQFAPILGEKTTFETAIDRISSIADPQDIYVVTLEKYVHFVKLQAPNLPVKNIIIEPERKDVGPAVGLALTHLRKMGQENNPVMILWSDHFVKNPSNFQKAVQRAEKMIQKEETKFVLIGETPRFASSNFGWIHVKNNTKTGSNFANMVYRPERKAAEKMFDSGVWLWNTGYFITTPAFVLSVFEKNEPGLYKRLCEIETSLGTPQEQKVVSDVYAKITPIHFDNSVVYNIAKKDAYVLQTNMGWEDPGTLYALKKHYAPGEDNATKGDALFDDSQGCMILNNEDKLVAGVGLDDILIVNTEDVLLVIHKDNVNSLSDLLKSLKADPKKQKYL